MPGYNIFVEIIRTTAKAAGMSLRCIGMKAIAFRRGHENFGVFAAAEVIGRLP